MVSTSPDTSIPLPHLRDGCISGETMFTSVAKLSEAAPLRMPELTGWTCAPAGFVVREHAARASETASAVRAVSTVEVTVEGGNMVEVDPPDKTSTVLRQRRAPRAGFEALAPRFAERAWRRWEVASEAERYGGSSRIFCGLGERAKEAGCGNLRA